MADRDETRPSGLGLTSLLLGSLGFCTAGVTGLIGFVMGLTAVIRISRSEGRVGGYGVAVAGLSVSAISMIAGPVLTLLVASIVAPTLAGARQAAHNAKSIMVLRELAAVTRTYVYEYGSTLPPGDEWVTVLDDFAGGIATLVSPDGETIYAMNRDVGGRRIQDITTPSRTVLFFEVEPGSPSQGGPELLPTRPAFIKGYVIVFVDGHTQNVRRERIAGLIW
jgi:DNA-binding beta-propeller fold protein YncE